MLTIIVNHIGRFMHFTTIEQAIAALSNEGFMGLDRPDRLNMIEGLEAAKASPTAALAHGLMVAHMAAPKEAIRRVQDMLNPAMPEVPEGYEEPEAMGLGDILQRLDASLRATPGDIGGPIPEDFRTHAGRAIEDLSLISITAMINQLETLTRAIAQAYDDRALLAALDTSGPALEKELRTLQRHGMVLRAMGKFNPSR